MKKNLLTAILMIAIFIFISAVSANAQTDLKGRYVYAGKEGENTYSFTLKFEGKDAVYYSYEDNGYGTLEGKWSIEKGIITVIIPKDDLTLMFKFRQEGVDLAVIEILPHSLVDAGAVFKKYVSKPSGPDLTAQDFGKRALKLIKSVRRLKDFSPGNIARQTNLKVFFNEENHREYGFGGNVVGAPDWTYGLSAYPYPSKDNKTTDTVRFSFDYQLHEPASPDSSAVCVDFGAFSKELTKAGFAAPTPIRGELNRILYWQSARDKTSLNISTGGKNKDSKSLCVKMVTVSLTK